MRASQPLVAAALLAAATPALADEPWVSARLTCLSAAGFDTGNEGAMEAVEYRLQAGLHLSERFDAGLDYRYTRYEYAGVDGRNRDLHRLEFPLGYAFGYGRWDWRGELAPGVSASSNVFKRPLERWTRDDATLRASVEGRRALRERWALIVGLRQDRRFGGQDVYPVVGLGYENAGTSLRLALPDSRLSLTLGNRLELTARIEPAGHRWHVVSDQTGARFDYRVRAWRGELTVSVPLGESLFLEVGGGYETGRRHYFTDDRPRRLAADADGQWLVMFGLRVSRPAGF